MCKSNHDKSKKREVNYMSLLLFKEIINKNKDSIYKFADSNTPKNSQGIPCVKKNEEWANEDIWDKIYRNNKGE